MSEAWWLCPQTVSPQSLRSESACQPPSELYSWWVWAQYHSAFQTCRALTGHFYSACTVSVCSRAICLGLCQSRFLSCGPWAVTYPLCLFLLLGKRVQISISDVTWKILNERCHVVKTLFTLSTKILYKGQWRFCYLQLELRNKLRITRDAAVSQLKNHTESMKLLERDIYEINRKLDIVNTENCRFKSVSILKLNSVHSQYEVLCSVPQRTIHRRRWNTKTTGQTLSCKGMRRSVFTWEGNKEEYPSTRHLPKA